MEMLISLTIISVYFLLSSSHQLICAGEDRLTAGKSISVNQTLISTGGIFALGFFNPGNQNSNRYYVGIWFNNIPGKSVVWVANRENPLMDSSSGELKVMRDGNIAVLDAAGVVLWSTNVPGIRRNATAVLLDSGNFVLREGDDGDAWQSFDHPTDTLLPTMKLQLNFRTGAVQSITAWKDEQDPSPGKFSLGINPKPYLQLVLLHGSEIRWRSQIHTGSQQIYPTRMINSSSLYVENVVENKQEIYWTYMASESFTVSRWVLNPTGSCSFLLWDNNSKNWTVRASFPIKRCDFYNRCGPSSECDISRPPSDECKCLEGFEPRIPKDWETGDFSGGCVRRMPLKCDEDDKFFEYVGMKLPDQFSFIRSNSRTQCENGCLASCRCTAYAYAEFSSGNVTDKRCFTWVGELIDLKRIQGGPEKLNVRLVASELDTNINLNESPKRKKSLLAIIIPTISIGVLLMGAALCMFRRRIKIREAGEEKTGKVVLSELDDIMVSKTLGSEKDVGELPLLDFSSVVAATNNFSTANKLGQGGFGPVYKGRSPQGQEIAVKRLSMSSGQGFREFTNEVKLIAKLQHTNLVRLLGWCIHEEEKILIYEYMPNKSLDMFVFDPTRSAELDWEKRFRIIEGIANGLLYLHRYSRLRVIHRDLKTSNILLDGVMNPKISDFGLARIFGVNQTEANTDKVVGTFGYMSPEYALDGCFSEKSDVFSFGVIMLELVTGKRSTGFYPYKESLNLLGYVWQLWKEGRGSELIDSSISGAFVEPEVVRCIQVGLLCIQEDAADRPTMSSIVFMLGKENATLPLPNPPAFALQRKPSSVSAIAPMNSSEECSDEMRTSIKEYLE